MFVWNYMHIQLEIDLHNVIFYIITPHNGHSELANKTMVSNRGWQ